MTRRRPRLREAVVGLALLLAAVLLLATGTDGSVTVDGITVGSRAVAAALLVVGFGFAAVLSLQDGANREGLGSLVAVLGWLCLLVASLTVFDVFAVLGVVLLVAAGGYLVAHALGVTRRDDTRSS